MAHDRQAPNQDLLSQIEKLRSQKVPDNDIGLLKSRIEEQSHLIMILKQRADENLLRCKTLEKLNDDLNAEKTSMKTDIEQERTRSARTEQQLATLKVTFDEVTRVNDQIKKDLENARAELSRSRDDASGRNAVYAELREKTAQLDRANALIIEEQEKFLELEERCRTLENELEKREKTLAAESAALRSQKAALESTVSALQDKLEEANRRNETLQSELRTARDELATFSRLRESNAEDAVALQKRAEAQDAANETLRKEVNNLRKQLADLQLAHSREMNEVLGNLSAKALQRRLDLAEQRIREMGLEYEAFKQHAKEQLDRETTINQQLRYLLK